MKIIISPAKKMINSSDDFLPESIPVFLTETQTLLDEIRTYTKEELKELKKAGEEFKSVTTYKFSVR